MPQTEMIEIIKKMARQKRNTILRNVMLLSTITLLNSTHNSLFVSSPLIDNFHFIVYCMTCGFSLINQDQDTGSPDSIFADLFWMFVVDSSAIYLKELEKKRRTLRVHM